MDATAFIIRKLCANFNARQVDAILAMLHADVLWGNAMEGGCVRGHAAVKAYWSASGRRSTRTSIR